MGAHVWQKDSDNGHTTVSSQPNHSGASRGRNLGRGRGRAGRPQTIKRKLVWSRNGSELSNGAVASSPPASARAADASVASHCASPPAQKLFNSTRRRQTATEISESQAGIGEDASASGRPASSVVPIDVTVSPKLADATAAAIFKQRQLQQRRQAALTKKMQDVAQLRREVHQRQRRQSAAEAAAKIAEQQLRTAADTTAAKARHSRQHLQAAFAEAFKEAAQQAAADATAPRPSASAADAAEVARVLAATSDYDCLQIPIGSSADVIRRRYRDMAKALHPDKCGAPGAKDAFQRLFGAYTNLRSFVA